MAKRKRKAHPEQPRKVLKRGTHQHKVQESNIIDSHALQSCYSSVVPLRQFLLDKLPPSSRSRRKRIAEIGLKSTNHAQLLDNTLVAVYAKLPASVRNARHQELITFTQTQRAASTATVTTSGSSRPCDVDEILAFAIWHLFRKENMSLRRPDHLLCHGFERTAAARSRLADSQHLCLPGITQYSVNSTVEAFKDTTWRDVLSCLGRDFEVIFTGLVLDHAVFVLLKSGDHNLYQLCGKPVYQMRTDSNRPLTKHGVHEQSTRADGISKCADRTPNEITLVRNRMFYARGSLNSKGNICLGLKHIHVFQRYGQLSETMQQLRFMQYIFPRQFHLHNVFTSRVDPMETAQRWKDYTVRDAEIHLAESRKPCRVPKRLRGYPAKLVSEIRKRHGRCSYSQLLNHYCPALPAGNACSPQRDTPIRDGLHDTGSHLRHDTFCRLADRQRPGQGDSFLTHATPVSHVSAFCVAAVRCVFPAQTWGTGSEGRDNWTVMSNMISRFVAARRFESFTLHDIAQCIKLRSLGWLRPQRVAAAHDMSMSDRKKRMELFNEFAYFLFDSFLIPLVRSNFFVTENAVHRNRLSFFRQDVWRKLSEPSLASIRLEMFEPMNPRQLRPALQMAKLSHSQLRLVPKEFGARPIVNLRRKVMKLSNGKRVLSSSNNTKLTPVFSVLNYERDMQPERLASALFSVNDIDSRLISFRSTLCDRPPRRLYFVKMDIRSCFDTIPQEALLRLINQILSCQEYRVTKHAESKILRGHSESNDHNLALRFVSKSRDRQPGPAFSEQMADGYAKRKRRTIFTATEHDRRLPLQQIQALLREHIQRNIVRIGRRHYRQTGGIPQGSVLSSLLCSYFYADFERRQLDFLCPSSSLLLRLIDDFLLITTDEEHARKFVNAMSDGHAEYGIKISPEKSLVNFEVCVQGSKIPRLHGTSVFPYCGIGINTSTLELSKDRQRRDPFIANSLTIDTGGKVVGIFQRRITAALKIQLHAMLLDGRHNGKSQILENLFGCFVETAMKLHQYRINLPRSRRPRPSVVINICRQLFGLGHKVMGRVHGEGKQVISRSQILWVACAAFEKVLARKQSDYPDVLRWLRCVSTSLHHQLKASTKELTAVVEVGMAPFAKYVY